MQAAYNSHSLNVGDIILLKECARIESLPSGSHGVSFDTKGTNAGLSPTSAKLSHHCEDVANSPA
jgi:hypothetical protein